MIALSSIAGVASTLLVSYVSSIHFGVWGLVLGSAVGYLVSGCWNTVSVSRATGVWPPWRLYCVLSVPVALCVFLACVRVSFWVLAFVGASYVCVCLILTVFAFSNVLPSMAGGDRFSLVRTALGGDAS